MYIGPFHFTTEISFGSVVTIVGLIFACVKYLRHFVIDVQIRNERVDKMWLKFNGERENDPLGWFNRFEQMERKVYQMWERLQFNRIQIDDSRTRQTDGR